VGDQRGGRQQQSLYRAVPLLSSKGNGGSDEWNSLSRHPGPRALRKRREERATQKFKPALKADPSCPAHRVEITRNESNRPPLRNPRRSGHPEMLNRPEECATRQLPLLPVNIIQDCQEPYYCQHEAAEYYKPPFGTNGKYTKQRN